MRNLKRSLSLAGLFLCLKGSVLCQPLQNFDARKTVQQLTNQKYHGRGYVRNGCNRAGNYLQKSFKKIGIASIAGAYKQPFLVDVNTFPNACAIRYGENQLTPGKDFIVHPKSGGMRNATLTLKWLTASEVLSYARNTRVDQLPLEAIAFKTSEVKDKDSLKRILRKLEQIAREVQPVMEFTSEKLTWSVADTCFDFPYLQIKIDPTMELGKTISINLANQMLSNYEVNNIVGVIPSLEKSEKYLAITAHYDHLGGMGKNTYFPGANDNASGVAMLLSLGAYFHKYPLKNHNVLLIAFAGEEAGLLGSQFFTNHPRVPLASLSFLLNVDIMGSGEEGITVVNGAVHKDAFERLTHLNDSLGILPQIKVRGKAANSDHYPFSEKGVPAFFFYTMGPNKHYHDIDDTYEALSFAAFDNLQLLIQGFFKQF